MSQLNRLAKTLQRATQAWADIEAQDGHAYEMRDVEFAVPQMAHGFVERGGLATFRVRANEPWLGGARREFVVTITESEVTDASR